MKAFQILHLSLGILVSLFLPTLQGGVPASPPDAAKIRKMWSPYFSPIPKEVEKKEATNLAIVDLGRHLFYEKALSSSGNRSCNECHDLAKYGTNGTVALELKEAGGLRRDVPSLYNLEGLLLYGWDARTSKLQDKVAHSLLSEAESGVPGEKDVVAKLSAVPAYKARFQSAFGDDAGITFQNATEALTTFIQGLVTRAPIDDFLLGDDKALDADQLRGALLFEQKNCSACHTGPAVGGQMIQIAGVIKPWPNQKDLGHFEVSGNPGHKMGFRVPPLRNVAKTAPYFHDHSARSLLRAIREISLYEQGLYLTFEEILLIESFLKGFTGEIPTDYISPPDGG